MSTDTGPRPPEPAVTSPVATAYASRLSHRRIILTTIAVISGMFLAALDGTVVATAMPTVIGDLHGIDHYAWVFTAYLLAEITSIPLWGRLADMFGRKRIFLIGMTLFLLGSVLCGLSTSMIELVLFRAMQGAGAGCLLPVAQTIIADLYTLEQRAKVSAVLSGTFGFASIVGPFIGGFLTDQLSWRWVFFVNLPIGIVAFVLVKTVMIEPITSRHRHRIDWLGAATLLGSTGLFVFALETGGTSYAWGSAPIVGAFVASALLLVAFISIERRVAEPIIPLALFRVPTLRAATVISVSTGVVLFGVISFLPLFVQVVLKSSATDAGRVLTPMMLAMMVGSALGARLVLKLGFRTMCMAGFGNLVVGAYLLTRVDMHSSQLSVSIAMLFLGFGMGLSFIATMLAGQNSVDLPRMGVATGLVNFTRQLGGALGVAVAAAVMLSTLTDRLKTLFPGVHIHASALLSPQAAKSFPPETQDLVRQAFADALHLVFVVTLVAAIIGAVTTLLMPRGRATDIRDAAHGRTVDEAMLPDGETLVITEPLPPSTADDDATVLLTAPVPPAPLAQDSETRA